MLGEAGKTEGGGYDGVIASLRRMPYKPATSPRWGVGGD